MKVILSGSNEGSPFEIPFQRLVYLLCSGLYVRHVRGFALEGNTVEQGD